jgi:thiamine-monophosphate kinase
VGEFDLIARYFNRPDTPERRAARNAVAALGIGDDCALLQPHAGTQIAISTDMLVEGRHFFANVDPATLGHKALAVNLSDLAACGAKPLAFTLALALPNVNEPWLAAFAKGLFALADAHSCELVGGDTTQGPLNICITVFGEVPVVDGKSQALLRSGAQPGDDIYVSGSLGHARLALEALQGSRTLPADVLAHARIRLEQPTPRVVLGQALRGLASSAIDISDGLLGDLAHVLKASQVGAIVQIDNIPNLIANYQANTGANALFYSQLPLQDQLNLVLAGGDDYELAFTAPPALRKAVALAAQAAQVPVTRVGQIDATPGLRLLDAQGQEQPNNFAAFDHFKLSSGG